MTEINRMSACINGHPMPDDSGLPDEERQPCPECGSKARKIQLNVFEDVGMSVTEAVRAKLRDASGKLKADLKAGDDWNRDRQEHVSVSQLVDKENKRYSKRVVAKDGTVLKDVSGSLEDQSLHGPQKPKPEPSDDSP